VRVWGCTCTDPDEDGAVAAALDDADGLAAGVLTTGLGLVVVPVVVWSAVPPKNAASPPVRTSPMPAIQRVIDEIRCIPASRSRAFGLATPAPPAPANIIANSRDSRNPG
jgi:hypothetical protein